jgi:hypothetical protein
VRIKGRRRVDVIAIGGASLLAAGVAAIGAFSYNEERIDRMWVGAQLDADESGAVHEVIDYNFGNASDRHGLLRVIPGLTPSSPFTVDSPDGAPDAINSMSPTSSGGHSAVEIRVGDATKTVTGRHRYVLDYRLDAAALAPQAPRFAWNAIGTEWTVDISEADVELVAPFTFDDVQCQVGSTGSTDACKYDEPEPGHLRVHVGKITSGHGVTLRMVPGDALAQAPALPRPPAHRPGDPGAGIAEPAVLAFIAALGAGLAASRLVRRAGRERVGIGAGGATDAAYAMGGSEQLVDAADLAAMATTEFAPPDDLTPSMGGMILHEGLLPQHKVAWLIEAAIAGAVDLEEEDGKTVRIDRLADGDPATQALLDGMFGGRTSIALGKYDSTFAGGWTALGSMLEAWEKGSGLWDARGLGRKIVARLLGILIGIVGLVLIVAGAAAAARFSPGYLGLSTVGAMVFGAGAATVIRGWELEVRTPRGSGQYLRVESFRRFLHDSEAYHAEEAAKRGVLREYTAWAVALGEVDRWRRAVQSSTVIPDNTAGLNYVFLAPMLASGVSHASTAPSSSGGGGGGGGVGGGGGGGGGGSW